MMGNLMGTITLDGWLARRVYRYLYRRHQLAVHGMLRGAMLIASEYLRDRVHPRLKLH
jgi:NADH dehydrogenase